MTEFEYDCLQEERRERHPHRLRGGLRSVTLPSDHLLPEELAQRSGPCRTYRLGGPMKQAEFEAMPADLRRLYLQRLRQRGGSESDVEQMLGADRGALRPYRVRFDRPDTAAWQAFLQPAGKEG